MTMGPEGDDQPAAGSPEFGDLANGSIGGDEVAGQGFDAGAGADLGGAGAAGSPAGSGESGGGHRRGRHARTAPRRRWRRRMVIGIVSFVAVIALLVGGLAAYAEYRFHQVKQVTVKNLAPVVTKGPHANAQTILMIGSTSRCVLNNQQTGAFGACDAGITGVNSDVIMLLHVDPNTHRVSILSLPRDLVLENVRPDQFHKVDAALAYGPSQLVAVIEQDYGIPINHFVELNFDSFQNVVNALGGISMYFPTPEKDDESALNITTAGCHHLNGFEALAVVRARHLEYGSHLQDYDGSGDLGRIIRDHEFLRVLATAISKRGLGNLLTDNSLIGAVAPQLEVDKGFSISDMVSLVWNFHSVNPNTAPQTTMPNIEDYTDYIYEGYDYGSVVFPSYPADEDAVDSFLGLTAPPGSTVSPPSVTVSVMDGASDPEMATTATAELSQQGFHATFGGEATDVGIPAETLVEYTPGHLLDAERVTESLSGIVSMAQVSSANGADVMVIAGTNFRVVTPPATSAPHSAKKAGSKGSKSGTTSSTSTSTTTTTVAPTGVSGTSGTSGTSTLGPVSSAVQSLPWYDPRACPAT